MNPVLYWNAVLLEASRRDHSQGYANGQQSGPTNTSRAMAIVHLAIHADIRLGAFIHVLFFVLVTKACTAPVNRLEVDAN